MREFREWQAYDRIEPFGEERADLRMAILATVAAQVGGAKNARPADFLPRFEPAKKKQTPEEMARLFRHFANAHNAANKRRS